MEASQRPEITNSHVPLAFLLGRRASEYILPSLATRTAPQRKPLDPSVFSDENAHVRRREAHAKQLLERVLAQESRLDTNQKYEPETPLEAPMARVSTADRRRRAVELQRVLKEQEAVANAVAATNAELSISVPGEADIRSRLYDQRELYASTHGYVLPEPDFVEVVGNPARIQRTQSVRQFHEDEKLKRNKLFRAKQSRRAAMAQHLQTQQADMKAKLLKAERRMNRSGSQHEEDEEKLAGGSNRLSAPLGADAVRQKQNAVKHWQDEQHRQLERTNEDERQQLQHRQELARRARQDTAYAVKARLTSSQFEKKTMAKIKGVGPSFQSALRIESDDTPLVSGASSSGSVLLVDVVTNSRTKEDEETGARRSSDMELVSSHLCARQYELFQKSQPRSLHLGGGFASNPRDVSRVEGDRQRVPHDSYELVAHANAIPLTKA